MVLSNKKLKQRLRAELAEKTAQPQTQSNFTSNAPTDSEQPHSLKQLLDSATQRPRLSKRGKRRTVRTSEEPEAAKEGGDGRGAEEGKIEVETVKDGSADLGKKKNKKRKRKVDQNSGNDVVEDAKKSQKKDKKKQKKQKMEAGNSTEDGKVEGEAVKDGSEDLGKNKKRKRKVEQDSGNGSVVEDTKNSQKKDEKKKKKKKPKQKKRKVEAGNGTDAGSNVTEVTGSGGKVAEVTKLSESNSSQGNGDDPTKVYVGGMPYYSSKDDIRSYFNGCGTITEVDCMTFPDSGKFRGIAIISFKTEAAAKRALALDGADMGGFFLKILPYKTPRAAKVPDFAPKMVEGYNRIYVGNLSWDITEDELKKFFLNCNISSIRFGMNKDTGEFKGYAHVGFADSKSLKTALTLDQKVLFGRPVRITCAVPLKKPESQTSHARSEATDKIAESQQPSSVSGKIRRRKCLECGEKGHLYAECPKKQTVDSTAS